MRSKLPEISSMTIGDKFLMIYIITSCFPVVYMFGFLGPDNTIEIEAACRLIDEISFSTAMTIYVLTLIYLAYKITQS